MEEREFESSGKILSVEDRISIIEKRLNIISDNVRDCCGAINANAVCIKELQEDGRKLHALHLERFEIGERSFNSWVKEAADLINGLQRGMMQMQEAYYHVFPERLAQDARMTEQLNALTTKPVADADPKKA